MTARKPPKRQEAPPPPEGLSVAGAARWAGLAADVQELGGGNAAEVDLVLLELVVRQGERLEEVRLILAEEGPTVTGSKGQRRPHPLLAAEGQLARDIAAGLERLRLTPKRRPWRAEVTAAGRVVMPS